MFKNEVRKLLNMWYELTAIFLFPLYSLPSLSFFLYASPKASKSHFAVEPSTTTTSSGPISGIHLSNSFAHTVLMLAGATINTGPSFTS